MDNFENERLGTVNYILCSLYDIVKCFYENYTEKSKWI